MTFAPDADDRTPPPETVPLPDGDESAMPTLRYRHGVSLTDTSRLTVTTVVVPLSPTSATPTETGNIPAVLTIPTTPYIRMSPSFRASTERPGGSPDTETIPDPPE